MNINLYKLSNVLSSKKEKNNQDSSFIDEINNNLFEEDLLLVENAKEALMDVVFIETGGTETKFLKLFPKLTPPIILLSNSKNNSLAACFEIKTFLNQRNINSILVVGDEKTDAELITQIAKVIAVYKVMNSSNLGVIGKPSDWLIASNVDYGKVKERFGINLVDIGINELKNEINKKKYGKVPHLKQLQEKVKDVDRLNNALYIYGALKRLITKYNLSGLTIRCFDLLNSHKSTACLALALLNEEGITATCEGDIPSLLTMYITYLISGRNPFQANPSSIDIDNCTLLLAHCTLPLNMTKSYSLPTHFESDLGIGIKGELIPQDVDILKLNPDLVNLTAFPARIKENLSLPGYCRTQILLSAEREALYYLIREPFGNHLVVSYDRVIDVFISLLSVCDTLTKKN
ncbi:MAG: hypothetical protein MJ227_04385 [Bacilli bacterium]|nr:hypothetical protein [Bacilli bacterium]